MSKYHQKQVQFIKSCLDRPFWYNECMRLYSKTWPMIKKQIDKNKNIFDFNQPPRLIPIEIQDDLNRMRNLYYDNLVLQSKPSVYIGRAI